MATSYLSIPVTGVASQALTQVQTRLDGVFGRRRIPLEYVRDGDGDLTEIIVILSDSLPEEDIRAFRRAMLNIDGTLGAAVDVPLGAGGGVAGGKVSDFDAQAPGAPVGFAVLGNVTVAGGSSSGPNLLHTDTGGGASGPNLLHTDGGGGAALDLSTTPVTVGLPILPGSLSISLNIGTAETITDDGAGNLTGTGGSLPGGGTINYATGAMTGTTAALAASSTVNESHTVGGSTHDLSGTPVTTDLPIQPGSLTLSGTIASTSETATDDGFGSFPSNTLLPSGGTVDYTTGALTGTTAVLDGGTTVTEIHGSDASLSAPQSAKLDSGAAAGDAALICVSKKGVGGPAVTLSWTFNVLFDPNFGLNNNSVSGGQALTLEARLLGAAGGRDIVLRWAATSHDSTPPAAWGTPTFANATPATSPTAALAVDIDAAWHEIVIRKAADNVIGVAYDGTEELFTFAEELVVPSKVLVNHNWGDALDRSFNIDNWSVAYTLPTLS